MIHECSVIHADGYAGFNELFAGNRIAEAAALSSASAGYHWPAITGRLSLAGYHWPAITGRLSLAGYHWPAITGW